MSAQFILNEVMLNVYKMSCFILLSLFVLTGITLSVYMMSDIMTSVVMMIFIMVNVIKLSFLC